MDLFLARQPIFNRQLKVEAYELLYRSNKFEGFANVIDGEQATSNVLTQSMLVTDFDKLVSNKRAFINFTGNLILEEMPLIFDKNRMVIEVLENVVVTDELIDAIKRLKLKGYTIALDDVVLDGPTFALAAFADIVKVDFASTTLEERCVLTGKLKGMNVQLLAEKVETQALFKEALSLGYHFFQGYFFAKPDMVVDKDIQPLPTTYMRIMKELSVAEPCYEAISDLIAKDVSLSYKLLKLINSPAFYRRSKIKSIQQALVLLGLREVKKWMLLLMLRDIGDSKPDELINTILIRGKMMEIISSQLELPRAKESSFLIGMMSLIDVVTDQVLEKILEELSLSDEICDAILKRTSSFGKLLSMVEAYEQNKLDVMLDNSLAIGYAHLQLPLVYFEAMEWAEQLLNEV